MNQVSPSIPSSLYQFPEVRVVEASAGSGKTYALAKRYVQLLMMYDLKSERLPIKNVLALTFTNKAAFEMKERILYFLKAIALDQLKPADKANILDPLQLDPAFAREKAFHIMEGIIHSYHFFQVQTIDKFINTLLSGCAFTIGLTSSFKIKTTAMDYLQVSLDRLVDQASFDPDIRVMFEEFLNNYLYLENRKGWFPKAEILSVVKALYDQNNTYGLEYVRSRTGSKRINDLKRKLLERIKMLDELLPERTNATFRKGLKKFIENHDSIFDVDSVPNFAKEEPPLNKGVEASAEVYELWDLIRTDMARLCYEEAYSLYNPYVDVYQQAMTLFYEDAARDDVLFLEELNKRARNLFDTEGITVEELYFRIATRISHYLIDEFQDTSRLQWSNLRMMPEEALSTGGSLFYVGDRKQAIYGFRGGDVKLFDEIKQDFKEYVTTDPLSNNYRSQKQIVEFNNLIFSVSNLHRFIAQKEQRDRDKKVQARVEFQGDDFRELANVFESSEQKSQTALDGGYVRICRVSADTRDEQLVITQQEVLEIIQDVRRRFDFRDIALLTRNNAQIELVTGWLLEADIPVESERTSDIRENQRIDDFLEFLRFLNSPINNRAFAKFIMSELFSRATGHPVQEFETFVFGCREVMLHQREHYLYQAFRKAYPDLWEQFIQEFYQNVGLYPLYELCISAYDRFCCLTNFPDEHGFFLHFLELIKKREEDHSDIASFLEYFEQLQGESLYVKMPDQNAVKILTVHKSKGLEFPVVILPFLAMNVQVGAKSSESAQSYVMQRHRDSMQLLRLKKTYYKYSDRLYQIYRKEYVHSMMSELNNVYVALTRASEELYCLIPRKSGNGFNMANYLIPDDLVELGQPSTERSLVRSESGSELTLDCETRHNWMDYLTDDHLASQRLESYAARKDGTILHFMLAQIHNLRPDDIGQIVADCMQSLEFEFPGLEDVNSYAVRLKSILTAVAFKPFFEVGDAHVYTEREVINRFGHSKRIDRLVVNQDEVWVLDYKSSSLDREQSNRQVVEYIEILTALYPEKSIRGYILYLDSLSVEEVHG